MQAKIIMWFKIKDDLKTYKSICRKFPDVPKEEMDMYLHHLCEIKHVGLSEQKIMERMRTKVGTRSGFTAPICVCYKI